MKKLLVGLCLAVPLAAAAEDFSYDYLAGGYANTQDDGNNEIDTGGLRFGWAPTSAIYTRIGANYSEVNDSSLEQTDLHATIGGYMPLSENIDIYLGGIVAWAEVQDVPLAGDVDGYGLGAEIGIRAWLFPRVELDLGGDYINLFEGDFDDAGVDTDDFSAGVALRVYPLPRFSVGGGYSYAFDAETETFSIDLRYDY